MAKGPLSRISHLLPHYRVALSARRHDEEMAQLAACRDELRALRDELVGLRAETAALEGRVRRLGAYASPEYAARALPAADGPRILVCGWYGADNLGDELMLRSVLEHLPDEALPRTTVMLWDNPGYERLSLDWRVRTVHYPTSTWELEQLADGVDSVVWGGGAILDERQFDGSPENVSTGNVFVRLNELVLARGGSVWCLGLSSNATLSDESYRAHLSGIVARASHFSLRDPYSLSALVGAGVPADGLSRCGDLVFGLSTLRGMAQRGGMGSLPAGHGRPEATAAGAGRRPLVVGFAFLHRDELVRAQGTAVHDVMLGLAEATGRPVQAVLIPLAEEGTGFDDRMNAAVREAARGIDASLDVRCAPYTLDLAASPLARCDACVSSKYHAALIAATLGIPTLGVVDTDHPHYANKMRHLAELGHFEDTLVTSSDFYAHARELAARLAESTAPHVGGDVLSGTDAYLRDVLARATRAS